MFGEDSHWDGLWQSAVEGLENELLQEADDMVTQNGLKTLLDHIHEFASEELGDGEMDDQGISEGRDPDLDLPDGADLIHVTDGPDRPDEAGDDVMGEAITDEQPLPRTLSEALPLSFDFYEMQMSSNCSFTDIICQEN